MVKKKKNEQQLEDQYLQKLKEHKPIMLKIRDIKVDSRIRSDYGDINGLSVSIEKFGLLHPICIDKDYNLIAGERRLRAHEKLGREEIEVKYLEDLTEFWNSGRTNVRVVGNPPTSSTAIGGPEMLLAKDGANWNLYIWVDSVDKWRAVTLSAVA